jgi:hypothetical protein
MRKMMTLLLVAASLACGKGKEGDACTSAEDCEEPLQCDVHDDDEGHCAGEHEHDEDADAGT